MFLKIAAVNTPTIKFSNASKKVNFGNSSSLSVNVGAEIVNVSNNQWNFSCEVDYASDATRAVGESLLPAEIEKIKDDVIHAKVIENLAKIHNGERDFKF